MSREDGKETLFQKELTKVEIIAGLRHALDLQYRRLCDAARSDWERLFGGKDPSDACVTVRVSGEVVAIQSSTVRGSGFLKSRRPSEPKTTAKHLPGYAH